LCLAREQQAQVGADACRLAGSQCEEVCCSHGLVLGWVLWAGLEAGLSAMLPRACCATKKARRCEKQVPGFDLVRDVYSLIST
jgi:hypothetical protein